MAAPPSYQEALASPDWLHLASPYVSFTDYHALCLVSRRCWRVFAPRLWANLLLSARLAGLHPGDDLDWWLDFVINRLGAVSPATRALVRVLDARQFAKDGLDFSSDRSERKLEQSFKRALELLPNVESLLLDGHPDVNLGFLINSQAGKSPGRLCLLSLSGCSTQLPSDLFTSPFLQGLVFLDISGLPGSIGPLLRPYVLPALRVLKLRDREIDDRALGALANAFGRSLWSLDLSGNKMTDAVIEVLINTCFDIRDLYSSWRFFSEGRLWREEGATLEHGIWTHLEDSHCSETLTHPRRYLLDTPAYDRIEQELRDRDIPRSDCQSPPRLDETDHFLYSLLYNTDISMVADHDPSSEGLTHLNLSNNEVSALGISKLLRCSRGRIESFSCDKMPFLPADSGYARIWPKSAKLYGLPGMEHIFRPVYSSNLRAVRIHHSLVTNIPTLEIDGLSSLACAYLAETAILQRVDEAFALTLLPDTNPRLTWLTLTGIPRRSTGPLIKRLIHFLRLLSIQERAVHDTKKTMVSWRSPRTLSGLRFLRLEFEPKTMEDDLYNAEPFSFFQPQIKQTRKEGGRNYSTADVGKNKHGVFDSEFMSHDVEFIKGKMSSSFWIGAKKSPASATLAEYRRLVVEEKITDRGGPVSPGQTKAGAIKHTNVFHTAWCMAVMPCDLPPPSARELAGMRDVVHALREYRAAGRLKYAEMEQRMGEGRVPLGEPHFYWRGRLEVLN